MELEFDRQSFEKKNSNIKFNQNPSSGSRVVPCGQTDMKVLVAFRDFANAPKTHTIVPTCLRAEHKGNSTFRIRNNET
jgi:hypothetical protein